MDKKIIDIIEQAFENIESIKSSSDKSLEFDSSVGFSGCKCSNSVLFGSSKFSKSTSSEMWEGDCPKSM